MKPMKNQRTSLKKNQRTTNQPTKKIAKKNL